MKVALGLRPFFLRSASASRVYDTAGQKKKHTVKEKEATEKKGHSYIPVYSLAKIMFNNAT